MSKGRNNTPSCFTPDDFRDDEGEEYVSAVYNAAPAFNLNQCVVPPIIEETNSKLRKVG